MPTVNENGYYNTEVSGNEYKIKETYMGTDLDSAARRLLAYAGVRKARVEYDGTMTLSVRRERTWSLSDVVPDGFTIKDVMVHDSDGANVHVDVVRDE